MKTLPNGVTVFNATPHVIRFWSENWDGPVEVEKDFVVSAKIEEQVVLEFEHHSLVSTEFVPDDVSWNVIARAKDEGAHVIVGSIIAAQAYPGAVMAMVPCAGYERVPPAEKRMRADKFTVF